MISHWFRHLISLLILLHVITAIPAISAQEAPAESSDGITLAASGLDNPRGFTWGSDGTLYIAQAGGNPMVVSDGATPVAASDTYVGTLSGSVVWTMDGCPVMFQDDLPSAGGIGSLDLGPSAVSILNGQTYVLDEGGGQVHGNPLTPDGIYAIDGSGSAQLVADIGAWVEENPVANPPENVDSSGDAIAMVTAGDVLWVLESNGGQLLEVTPDGEITRVADLSEGNMYPGGLAVGPDGSAYVGFLTQTPYVEGAANVVNITANGVVTDVWTGLTAVTAVAVAPDGTLFALELGTANSDHPLSVTPHTGRVVRQNGPDSSEAIAVNIDTPIAMAFGPDQGLYVTIPAVVSDDVTGAVIRMDLNQGQVMTMSNALLADSPCLPATTPVPELTVVASPDGSEGTPSAGTPDVAGDDATVSIENYSFGPESLNVTAGTSITWTNNDTTAHTVTSPDGAFDSGNISPGETFTFTFTDTGTFNYICSYHPNMTASIVVQ